MIIRLSPTGGNDTPAVIGALEKLRENGGGELRFASGEYHFFRVGTRREFFAVSNNSACDKYMVFPLIGMKDLTVDGSGALFVFHEITFPFLVSNSQNITLKNFTVDTGSSPLVEFSIRDHTDEGFYMDIDAEASPFFVENESLCFRRENGVLHGLHTRLTLHAIGRHEVQYFATGDCKADLNNLSVSLMRCDVSPTPTGVYARYRADSPSKCVFGEETVTSIVDGKREVDVICLDRSENVTVKDVRVARGIGMGIVGQLSKNITVDGFCTAISHHPGARQTLTADALHFIHCDGNLEVKNCVISDIMDDVINVHGIYTTLERFETEEILVSLRHQEQYFFNPYRTGDRLEVIDPESREIVAEFLVAEAEFSDERGIEILLKGSFSYGFEGLQKGFWIENPDRMPNLHLHHNDFYNYPNLRVSGAGEILIEENRFSNCKSGLVCMDLANYWYESGRVKHLCYRNNLLENCNQYGGKGFLRIGVDGVVCENAPKIHERIEIIGNRFSGIKTYAVSADAVKELILRGNVVEDDREGIFRI